METDDYKKMSKGELVKLLESLLEGREPGSASGLLRELQARQIELERQNRELSKAQRTLEEARDRYAEFFDFAPAGYLLFDETGCIQEINLTGASMLGVERSRLIGKPFISFLERASVKKFHDHLLQCRETGEKATAELDISLKGGAKAHAQIMSVPLKGPEGIKKGYRSAITDMAEQKRAEEEKAKIQEQLFQVQKMETIGKLAGGIAHDFNNLMTIIASYSGLAMKKAASRSLKEYLDQIRASADRAAALTRQLLVFSRKQPAEPALLDLNASVEEMMKILRHIISENISIKTVLGKDLWAIKGDKGNMEQLIMNLVINAKDALPQGGDIIVTTENAVFTEKDCKGVPDAGPGRYVCLKVEDTGTGMGKDVMEHLFEPFFSTKEAKGTGLGLSVVKSIVKEHKGWIDVRSEVGRGSQFKVCIPIAPDAAVAGNIKEVSAGEPMGRGERVLIVEDEKHLRKSVALVLQKSGYRVFEAASARDAISIFEKENGEFDLVLSDMVPQDKNGVEMAEELIHKRPGVHILFTSGYVDIESEWPVLKERGFNFLQKPFEIPELLRLVRESIGKAGLN
ncbi:MAG: response regulator [Deltaproteobacteria bacterium]|nr:response regulator [Deltaproteobacteria bacterium]